MELRRATLWATGLLSLSIIGCGDPPPGRTYYQRNIEPILTQKCAGNTSGCHSVNDDDVYKFAAGNFDVANDSAGTSFENVQKRRDVLESYGPYPFPLLIIKGVGADQLQVAYGGVQRDIQVQHVGGPVLVLGSDAFYTLQTWLDNGATENGLKPSTPPQTGSGSCSTALPPGFDPTTYQANPNFASFKSNIQPIIDQHGCNAASCHGAPASDFYITCGADDTQLAFNFSQAWSFVNNPVDDSQILRIPLAVNAGGRGHTGGDQFASTDDGDYQAIKTWATAVGVLDFANGDPVKKFFADNVQPILLQRGCSFQACHSPSATNDFKLRSGTQGFFSAVSLERNYELLKDNFMALEFPDARRGRAVGKTLLPPDPNVPEPIHRGGAVLETQGQLSQPTACAAVYDPATATPYCTIQQWVTLERAAIPTQVTNMDAGSPISLVYVERAAGSVGAGRLEFDTFQGNGDLRVVTTTFGAGQQLNAADEAASTSLLGGCAGLTAGAVDVQAPDVSNDGTRVAFAARANATSPLGVYIVDIDGNNCQLVTPAAAASNGLQVHNFDPAWSPDGNYLVFASTRGKAGAGATKSRKRFLPQSDLWRVAISGHTVDQNSYTQMTFLSNSEVSPQFMREGRVTMTTEKVSTSFYQLSGRRINWDLTDYHPLLGQRQNSAYSDLTDLTQTKPSIGYMSATDIREGADGNFLLILSDLNADGTPTLPGAAGALATFNRSIGPFESDRTDASYLKSVHILDAAATGHAGATTGYRAPSSLPDGSILVSYASNLAGQNWDIVSVSQHDQTRTNIFSGGAGGKVRVDAVLAYKYPARVLYDNRRQLVFGGGAAAGDDGHATLTMPDAPMTFTMLTGNLRRGRPVEAFRNATHLVISSEGMCPAGSCTPGAGGFFESRSVLGSAQLAADGSVNVKVPSRTGIVLELQDDSGNTVVQMGEEHQLGPGEHISMGVSETLFNAVCGGCHGSVSGSELDIAVSADALTGASQSMSAGQDPTVVGN